MVVLDVEKMQLSSPLVASVGFFDGVHVGHRYLIEQVKKEAQRLSLPSAIITFFVHPRITLNKNYQPALLCSFEEKIERLASTNIEYCIPLNFSKEMSQMPAKTFMYEILKEQLSIDTLIIGYDHKFGHDRRENFSDYVRYGKEMGITVLQASELSGSEHVSSSVIRNLLKEGNVRKAAEFLSYNYTISGKIVEGYKVGRTIGFPTANMKIWEDFKVIPAFGVYAVYVHVEGRKYGGMLYIGKRPTLQNGDNISLEVNIFDFDEDIYNKTLTAEFLEFVRHDEKFENVEKLKAQIFRDKEEVKKILSYY